MKWIAGAIAVLALILIINEPKYRRHVAAQEAISSFMEQSSNMSAEMKRQAEQSRINSYNAEKMKVFVPGRDSRTCMEILGVNEINNRVVECNKDHYVEMRRDEVDDFKKEQRLP